jgi:hypothetical protein
VGLVTNAREVERNGRGRKGNRGTTSSPGSGTQSALVTEAGDGVADAQERLADLDPTTCMGAMRPFGEWPSWRERLRSVCRQAGEVKRRRRAAFSGTKPERNAAAEPQTEAAASAVETKSGPVTSGHKVQQNGRGRKGNRETTNSPGGETQRTLVTDVSGGIADACRRMAEVVRGDERCSAPPWPMAEVGETASVCGRRAEVERRRRGAYSAARPERNGNAEPQTEANVDAVSPEHPARDDRALGGAEQAWSRRESGPRPEARGAQPSARWSRRSGRAPMLSSRDFFPGVYGINGTQVWLLRKPC